MPYYNPIESTDTDEKTLAYDLRQYYAKIVGEHMVILSMQRKEHNFFAWYKAIEDLYTITSFNFHDPEEDKEGYKQKKQDVLNIANKYSSTWLNQNTNSKEAEEIDRALRALEEYLYDKMKEGNMFGSKYSDDEGL